VVSEKPTNHEPPTPRAHSWERGAGEGVPEPIDQTSAKTRATLSSPTMADLARLAGVSAITVSRALRGSHLVNLRTRERIAQIARQAGYTFNASARNLRLGRSMTIAVVVEMQPSRERQMSGPYPLDLLGGITQELTSVGYSVLFTTLQGGALPNVQAADGVILLGQGAHEDAMHEVQRWGRPMVVWGAVSHHESQIVVGSDNYQGGTLAAERFLALGRRHPVFLGDPAHAEFAERLDGFTATLARVGLTPHVPKITGLTVSAGAQAVRALLARRDPLDALFAASDLLAIGAIRALTTHGLSVPEQVSVIGYDDSPLGATYLPPLSSIHQNFTAAGGLLARKICALIEGQTTESETLPTHLVLRET